MASSTDKELLELAAKAAGIYIEFDLDGKAYLSNDYVKEWNPLTDDGDALRLAVKLKLIITFADGGAWPHVCVGRRLGPFHNEKLPNKMFALDEELELTRRAIVRAAAELGKASVEIGKTL